MTDALASLPSIAVDAIGHTLGTGRRRLPAARRPVSRAEPPGRRVRDARTGRDAARLHRHTHGGAPTRDQRRSQHAIGAAFDDPRLPAVDADDFAVMRVKVSVLSEPRPLAVASRAELVDALEPEVTGVVVTRDQRRATFLPAVWAKLADPDDFIDALWAKAGLRARVWDARVARGHLHDCRARRPRPPAPTGIGAAPCLTLRSLTPRSAPSTSIA